MWEGHERFAEKSPVRHLLGSLENRREVIVCGGYKKEEYNQQLWGKMIQHLPARFSG
jgi:arginine decarboxylase-like protein